MPQEVKTTERLQTKNRTLYDLEEWIERVIKALPDKMGLDEVLVKFEHGNMTLDLPDERFVFDGFTQVTAKDKK